MHMRFCKFIFLASFLALALNSSDARAEFELQAYGGANTNFRSKETVHEGPISNSRTVSWDGKPFIFPPYWGIRGTYWLDSRPAWGVGLDYTHTKAYAGIDFASDPTFDHFEFTDGNNLFIVNLLRRWKNMNGSRFTPYVGGGVGISIPHTEVTFDSGLGLPTTSKYEFGGPAADIVAGAHYNFTQHWGVFGEGKLSYEYIDAGLDGGGSVRTQLWTPQIALGFSYNF